MQHYVKYLKHSKAGKVTGSYSKVLCIDNKESWLIIGWLNRVLD